MEVFIGTVQAFGFSFAPRGWALCAGQMLNINANTALYSLMGTTYGGNGQTTFGLPNLQGRTIVGMGTSTFGNYMPGQVGGNTKITLTQNQMPIHTHGATASGGTVSVAAPIVEDTGESDTPSSGSVLAGCSVATNIYSTKPATGTMAPGTGTLSGVTVAVTVAGGSQPIDIESPYLAMNYCICVQGLFPSRN